jgi:hypothetical protein
MITYAERLRRRDAHAARCRDTKRANRPMQQAVCQVCGRVYMVRASATTHRDHREACSTMCLQRLIRRGPQA